MRGRAVSTMFRKNPYPSERILGFAQELRKSATPHEDHLWRILRRRQFSDFKFRRQVPIGPFIADFACYEAKLIIELDGSQHGEDELYDSRRDAELKRRGFRVLRFWNGDLKVNLAHVLDAIDFALREGSGAD